MAPAEAAAEAAAAAEGAAEATKTMQRANVGRASYQADASLAQTADPGAQAVAVWMRALATL